MGETITLNKEQLEAMTPADRNNAFTHATRAEGTVVVRRADGSVKYDNVALKGTYGEGEIA